MTARDSINGQFMTASCPTCGKISTEIVASRMLPGHHDTYECFCICPKCTTYMIAAFQIVAYPPSHSRFAPRQKPVIYESRLYPARTKAGKGIPANVARSFDEAISSLEAGNVLAAVIMCRTALQAMCLDQSATEQTLDKQLLELVESQKLNRSLYDWTAALRRDGNLIAHDLRAHTEFTREDAEDIVSFTNAIFEHVYVLNSAFEKYRSRHEARQTKAKAD